jgi:hypothetical protein
LTCSAARGIAAVKRGALPSEERGSLRAGMPEDVLTIPLHTTACTWG